MKHYTIYFQIFGKKMKFKTMAQNAIAAKDILYTRLEIIEIKESTTEEVVMDKLKDIFDQFK